MSVTSRRVREDLPAALRGASGRRAPGRSVVGAIVDAARPRRLQGRAGEVNLPLTLAPRRRRIPLERGAVPKPIADFENPGTVEEVRERFGSCQSGRATRRISRYAIPG